MSANGSLPEIEKCLESLAELKPIVKPLSALAESLLLMAIEDLEQLQAALSSYLPDDADRPPIV
jgi:hypothetical protein